MKRGKTQYVFASFTAAAQGHPFLADSAEDAVLILEKMMSDWCEKDGVRAEDAIPFGVVCLGKIHDIPYIVKPLPKADKEFGK